MFGGSVVEDHVQHDINAACFAFFDKLLKVGHSTIAGINIPVILYIIAVILLRRNAHGIEPDTVDAQLLKIIKTGNHALNITPAISAGITE